MGIRHGLGGVFWDSREGYQWGKEWGSEVTEVRSSLLREIESGVGSNIRTRVVVLYNKQTDIGMVNIINK
jgi:hypothetical protein